METRLTPVMKFEGCGAVIRDARIAVEKSLRQVAEEAGCNPSYLSKLENNLLALSTEVLQQLSKPLSVKTNELVLRCLKFSFPSFSSTPSGKVFEQILMSE